MGGHQCHEKKYTSHNEVSTWQNHNNNWNGKSKREKGTPSQRFLFNVTTRLCHWHCAWRGLCGLGECWWGRQCQRSWPSCAVESNSSATVWAFVFVGMYVCAFQLVQRYVQVCLVCLFACTVYVEESVCQCVCTLCSSLYTVCMYPPLKDTNTHCLLFWDLGQNWASYCFLVFTSQNGFFLHCLSSPSPFPLKHYLPKDEWGRGYLIQTSCTYVCFTSEDG